MFYDKGTHIWWQGFHMFQACNVLETTQYLVHFTNAKYALIFGYNILLCTRNRSIIKEFTV